MRFKPAVEKLKPRWKASSRRECWESIGVTKAGRNQTQPSRSQGHGSRVNLPYLRPAGFAPQEFRIEHVWNPYIVRILRYRSREMFQKASDQKRSRYPKRRFIQVRNSLLVDSRIANTVDSSSYSCNDSCRCSSSCHSNSSSTIRTRLWTRRHLLLLHT